MSAEIVVAGFLIGLLIGLTGIGGGSLITPILIFVFRVPPLLAVGTDLTLGAITKIAGAVTHIRLGNCHAGITNLLLSGSIPGALTGLLLLRILPALCTLTYDSIIRHTLGIVLLLVSVALFFPSVWKHAERLKSQTDTRKYVWLIRSATFTVGLLVSITSVGSGSLLVPLMLAAVPLPFSQIIGIDVVHGALLTSVAAAGHIVAMDSLNYKLLANLLLGSLPGVVLGSRLTISLPRRAMEIVVGSMLVVSGVKLL
jgi:uncharacterized protein